MFCYHINVGHPVLDEGARFVAPIKDVVWAAHAGEAYRRQKVGYRTLPGPQMNFHEQVWQHELGADNEGRQSVAVMNDRIGIGFEVTTGKAQFPCLYEWQNLQAGQYALGIEPSTNHVLGNLAARKRNELIWLEHSDERKYESVFRVLAGKDEIAAAEEAINAVTRQPSEEFPEPSGNYLPIGGRT
jgi:hypothetical protein